MGDDGLKSWDLYAGTKYLASGRKPGAWKKEGRERMRDITAILYSLSRNIHGVIECEIAAYYVARTTPYSRLVLVPSFVFMHSRRVRSVVAVTF